MSRRSHFTPTPTTITTTSHSHASHALLVRRNSSSPLLLHSPSPTHRSSANSTTSHQSVAMEYDDVTASPPPEAPPPSSQMTPSSVPVREDCWSESATYTLIEAWGDRYVELNRGNLRQKHWQEVADAVNARHGHLKKARRTDIQCKNRIDTLKKKYKIEKLKVLESKGNYTSPWPFFVPLDSLIGSSFKLSPPALTPHLKTARALPAPPFPVGLRSKRPVPALAPSPPDSSYFRRNFSAMAAAAAAAEEEEESDTSRTAGGNQRRLRERENENEQDLHGAVEAYRQLAEAIGRFGEIYERVEEAKQRQMVELEKQRMQFTKDLEIQRMKLFMESQVQLEKLKRSKRNSEPGECGGMRFV